MTSCKCISGCLQGFLPEDFLHPFTTTCISFYCQASKVPPSPLQPTQFWNPLKSFFTPTLLSQNLNSMITKNFQTAKVKIFLLFSLTCHLQLTSIDNLGCYLKLTHPDFFGSRTIFLCLNYNFSVLMTILFS